MDALEGEAGSVRGRWGQRLGRLFKFFKSLPLRNPANKGAERKVEARATFGPSIRELSPIFGSSVEERKGGNAVSSLPQLFRCPVLSSCASRIRLEYRRDALRRDRFRLTRRRCSRSPVIQQIVDGLWSGRIRATTNFPN